MLAVRVSGFYKLGRTQGDLDFVDVDITNDTPVFLDPLALRTLRGSWGAECVGLLQDFFETVVHAIRDGKHERARALLSSLREPNETHLGLSQGKSRGRALGTTTAGDIWKSLVKSEAIKSGLLVDLEDAILMVEGIGADLISDITTNIIREPLIHYTQQICHSYGIPLQNGIDSGPLWDPNERQWVNRFEDLPLPKGQRLLLVPKIIVRARVEYDPSEYYQHFILPYLQRAELEANSELVHLLKDKTRRVTKKDLARKYGSSKADIVRLTQQHPEILADYRKAKRALVGKPMSHYELGSPPDWDELLRQVTSLPAGREHADAFNKAISQVIGALFSPSLTMPKIEYPIHDGRKRIDIRYVNEATTGFFSWLRKNYACPYIYIECKNYSGDPANPELDQLAGRFSPRRGRVGILVCRTLEDRSLFTARCKDTAHDDRGFIMAMDDRDISHLVALAKQRDTNATNEFLRERFDELIM